MHNHGTDPRARGGTLILCICAALCEGIDLQAAGVAAAGISADFNPTPDQFGTFFSASTLGLFFGALIGGHLADLMGRKKVLVASVAVFGFFSLLTAFAWDVPSLTWVRLLTGLGFGGAMPILLALAYESSSSKKQSASVAIVYAAAPLGGAIVSLISLLIAAQYWRVMFVVGGILPLMLAPVLAFWLRESDAFQPEHSAKRGKANSSRGHGNLKALFGPGTASRTALLWLSLFLGLLLLYLLLNWLPSLLMTDGLTRLQAAGVQIDFNIGGVLAALLIGYLLGGRLRNVGIVVTFVALPILLVVLARAPAEVAILSTVVFFLGCCVMAAQAFLYTVAPAVYPTSTRAFGVGAAVAAGRVGSFVGPQLGGILKSAGHSPSRLLMDLLPLVLAGSVCALLLAWVTRKVRAKSLSSAC